MPNPINLLEASQRTNAYANGMDGLFPETPPESLDMREPLWKGRKTGAKSHTPETRRKISEKRKEWWRNKKRPAFRLN